MFGGLYRLGMVGLGILSIVFCYIVVHLRTYVFSVAKCAKIVSFLSEIECYG